MSKRNKAREIWLDRYRAALVQACGAAAILGFTDHAATLCEMIDAARVDSRAGKCYNTNNQRRQARKMEDKIMTRYNGIIARWQCANGDTITAYDLGRDGGADLVATNADGAIIAYVSCDDGDNYAGAADSINASGLVSTSAVFDGWENGLGGSPFDMDFFPREIELI